MSLYSPTYIKILNPKEDYNLYYGDWNKTAKQVVLCLHGLARNSRDFDFIATTLTSYNLRVICPDLVGRGKSDWLVDKNLYTYSTYCKSIIYLLHQLNIERVSIIGTSLGGIIAMYLAEYMPSLCQSIILNDIGPFMDSKCREVIAKYISYYPQFDDLVSAENYLKSLLHTFGIKKEEDWLHLTQYSFELNQESKYVLNFDPDISKIFKESLKTVPELDLWETWYNIPASIPILVIRGALSKVLSISTVKKMLDCRKNTDFIQFEGVGHTPALLESEQTNPIIKWLLK